MGVNGIYGLSGSGLDIESMVKVGMMSKQNEYDKMAQKYTKNEWTKAAYLDISNQITTFNMSTLSQYKLSSNMNAKTTTSSNESAVTAIANASAANMNHKVVVDSLSSNAYLISQKNAVSNIVDSNGGSSGSIKLQDILFKGLSNNVGTLGDATYSYTGGKTISQVTFDDNVSINTTKDPSSGSLTSTATAEGINLTVTKDSNGTHFATANLAGTNISFDFNFDDGSWSYSGSSDASSPITLPDGSVVDINPGNFSSIDSMNFTRSLDGTSKISIGDTTFSISADHNTITGITKSDGTTYSSDGSTTATGVAAATTTYTTTFDNGKQITLTKNSDGTADATYNDGTTTYTSGSVSGDTITFGTLDSGTYGKVTLDVSDFNNSSMKVETQKYGIVGNTIGGTLLFTDNFEAGSNTLALTDTAIAFKIGDGSKETDTISYTYADLLGGGKTINDLVSDINSKANSAGLNVKASYDVANDIFSLYNSKGGNENQILITALDGQNNSLGVNSLAGNAAKDFFNALGLKQSTGDTLKAPSAVSANASLLSGSDDSDHLTITNLDRAEGVAGTNGKIIVDGVEYDNVTDNKVTVGGVTYNAHNTTVTKDSAGTVTATNAANVSIGQDTDAIVDKVKSFVESYNKILSSLYEKYDEKPDSAYKPLTQSQKDAMKDEQIEKWEEKAKKGLLYHDSTLGKIINEMRDAISQSVNGVDSKYNSAYSIGISTTGIKGQLVLDETKLKNALSEDSDSVYNVFAKLGNVTDEAGKEDTKYNGIAQRLGDIFTTATKSIKTRAGSSADISEDSDLNNLLRELQTKMSNFKKLMSSFENKLYKKYDAMEATLAKLGSQLNFITGGQ